MYFTKSSSCFLPPLQPILSVANRECNFLVLRWFDAITDVSVLHSSVDLLHPCTVLGDIISRHLQKPCIEHVCIFKCAFRKQEHKSAMIMNYSMSRQKAQCGDPRKPFEANISLLIKVVNNGLPMVKVNRLTL